MSDFHNAVAKGGTVRVKHLSGGRYMYICNQGNKDYMSEVYKSDKMPTAKQVRKDIRKG